MQSPDSTPTPRASTRWRDVIKIHPAADLIPPMTGGELTALGADIRKHGLREPVVFIREYRRREGGTLDVREYDLVLIDGRSRLDAMEQEGFVLVRDGKLDPTLGHKALGLEPLIGGAYAELEFDSVGEIYAFVMSRNIHRRHLLPDKKDETIAALIKADPSRSDRQIAEMVKASPTTVGKKRAKLEASGVVSTVDTRTDKRGRQQPAKKALAKPTTKAKPESAEQPAKPEPEQPKPKKLTGKQMGSGPREQRIGEIREQLVKFAGELRGLAKHKDRVEIGADIIRALDVGISQIVEAHYKRRQAEGAVINVAIPLKESPPR